MILDLFKLDGKVAIVTGGTTGLGQGICIALAEAGADIACVGSSDRFAETRSGVEKAGQRFLPVRADLQKMESIAQIVEQTREHFGRIDILVNNAGIIRRSLCIDFTEKDWDDTIQLNLKSVFFLSQAVARVFVEQGSGGKIINIASMMSYQGGIRIPAYTASKSGLAGLTKILANEWAGHNINVNAIAPGYFATAATAAVMADEARNKSIVERIPAGRWGVPADLGGTAVFLASAASDYCHGSIYPVDGGWLAR